MNVLIVHNRYSRTGGEEKVVEMQKSLLESAGHKVYLYQRDYHEMDGWKLGRFRSFFTAIRNSSAIRDIRKIFDTFRPDIAIVHNLFPIVSPAVLKELHRKGVRIAMTVHNYRLFCPIGLFFRNGEICTQCAESHFRELCCTFNRCQGTLAGSAAFTVRSLWSRLAGYFNYVDIFLPCSQFQKSNLIKYGIPENRIKVIPNFTDSPVTSYPKEEYVAFVGRLSEEKGIDILMEIAAAMPDIQFRVAGKKADGYSMPSVPENVVMEGFLSGEDLRAFYGKAKVMVFTSKVWESMPLTPIEAMASGTAVVAKRVSSVPEILEDDYIFQTIDEAVSKIRLLFSDDNARTRAEESGRAKVKDIFSPGRYLKDLEDAITRH